MSKVASEKLEQRVLTSLRYISNDMNSSFPVVSVKRVKQNACKDLLKVDSQKSKAMDHNSLSSKLTILNKPVSKTNKECQTIQCIRTIYQMFPEISDIPDIDKAT